MLFHQPAGPVDAQTLSAQRAVFPSGVCVSGRDIGGLTFDEAYEQLQTVEKNMLNEVEFILSDGNHSETFTAADMTATFNTQEVLTQAWADAQNRQNEERDDVLTMSNRDKFEIDYVLDVSGLRSELEEFAQEVYREPVDASVAIDLTYTGWFRYTEGVAGKTLDTDALYGTIALRAQEKRFGTVELPITYTDPAVTVEQLQQNLVKR
ncbi:MAG: peptidoglycan binding domain-containing protein, partial [Clostridia bacterium]|nr:peptidoglycan binding domain-containing protein [Clostridia bacterium]